MKVLQDKHIIAFFLSGKFYGRAETASGDKPVLPNRVDKKIMKQSELTARSSKISGENYPLVKLCF
jgi:hypothetical protein